MLTNMLYALQCFVYATALAVEKRDVFNPLITYPTNSTIWNVGEVHNVTWSIDNAPPGYPINNATGTLLLGFLANDSENLDIDHPLADKFLLKDTSVQITVPDVESRNDYIVVLLGDSGNASPQFTIHNVTIGNPPSSSSTTATASSTSTSMGDGTNPVQMTTSSPQSGTTESVNPPLATPTTPSTPTSGSPQPSEAVTTVVVSSSSSGSAVPTAGSAGTGSASGFLQSGSAANFLSSFGLVVYFLL